MEKKKISKISRVLSIYHLLLHCDEVSWEELAPLTTCKKTIQRDIALIRQAGGQVRFRKTQDLHGYVMDPKELTDPIPTENKAQQRLIQKLRRLFVFMRYLDAEEDCDIRYRELFPNVSKRTMQRDFAELNKLGFNIHYERELDALGYDPDEPHPKGGRYMNDYLGTYGLSTLE